MSKRKFDPTYKLEVCKTVDSGHATVAEMSRETEISEDTLYTWMKRYREKYDKTFVGSGHLL